MEEACISACGNYNSAKWTPLIHGYSAWVAVLLQTHKWRKGTWISVLIYVNEGACYPIRVMHIYKVVGGGLYQLFFVQKYLDFIIFLQYFS